jgi:hypothetical protein
MHACLQLRQALRAKQPGKKTAQYKVTQMINNVVNPEQKG